MFRRRLRQLGIALTSLAVLFAVIVSMLHGLRHSHSGGDVAHSHSGSQEHSAAHSHGSSHVHSHSHSHEGHSHGSVAHSLGHVHRHDDVAQSGEKELAADSPHVHVSLFGMEITLPDFAGMVPKFASNGDPAQPAAARSEIILLGDTFGLTHAVLVIAVGIVVFRHRVRVLLSQRRQTRCDFLMCHSGIDRAAPPLPPPQVA